MLCTLLCPVPCALMCPVPCTLNPAPCTLDLDLHPTPPSPRPAQGNRVVSGDNHGMICVWEKDTGGSVQTLPLAHSKAVLSVSMSADGSTIASVGMEGGVSIRGGGVCGHRGRGVISGRGAWAWREG